MATESVHLLVEMTVLDGKLVELEQLALQMIEGSRKETETLGYDWFLAADRKRCHLIETYKNSDALVAHFNGAVVQELLPKMRELVKIDRMTSYGKLNSTAAERLKSAGIEVFESWHRLER